MRLIFSEQAREEYLYWQKNDSKLLERVNTLIKEAMRHPFTGTGKPEPLKHALAGYWSRRMNDEHSSTRLSRARCLLHNCATTTAHNNAVEKLNRSPV